MGIILYNCLKKRCVEIEVSSMIQLADAYNSRALSSLAHARLPVSSFCLVVVDPGLVIEDPYSAVTAIGGDMAG